MICNELNSEHYQLYIVGLAEEAEVDLIRSHLRESCPRCIAELRSSVEFWYLFALAGIEQSNARPSRDLRSAIMAQVSDRTQARWWSFQHWGAPQAVAASLTVVMASGLGWYAGDQGYLRRSEPKRPKGPEVSSLPQIRPPSPRPEDMTPTPPAASPQAQEELEALRTKLARVESELAAQKVSGGPGGAAGDLLALQKALTDTTESLKAAQQAKAQQDIQVASLERDLQSQRSLLAVAIRERQDAESRNRALAENKASADEKDRQVRALMARVTELEQENVEFRKAVNRQRRQLDENIQVASFLSSPTVKMVKLQPTEKSETASAYALVEGTRVLFVASKLPSLPSGRQYQLWLIRGRGTPIVSGGVFSMTGQQATLQILDPKLLVDLKGLAVTDEPMGGSPLPTGHKFLVSTTRG